MKLQELQTKAQKNKEKKLSRRIKPVNPEFSKTYPRFVWGIDPGLNGGFARFDRVKNEFDLVELTPLKQGGITKKSQESPVSRTYDVEAMNSILDYNKQVIENSFVIIERSQVMSIGGVQQGSVSNFTIGYGYGLWIALLTVCGYSHKTIPPVEWNKYLFKEVQFRNINNTKERSIRFIETFFPNVNLIPKGHRVKHDGIADACCLAIFGVQKYSV